MSVVPKTTCVRCHRPFSSLRASCPYCGQPKPKEVSRPVPVSDSAVRGTSASVKTGENLHWQMLFGTILVAAILAVVIIIVSVGVRKAEILNPTETVEDVVLEDVPQVAATAVPTPTVAPTAAPTPTPSVTSITIYYGEMIELSFTQYVGDEIQLKAITYPLNSGVEVEWSSDDESVCTVDETGLVILTGPGNTYIHASAGGVTADCQVISRE